MYRTVVASCGVSVTGFVTQIKVFDSQNCFFFSN